MRYYIIILLVMFTISFIGCAGMHETVEEGGKVVGSVAAIPQSAGQGMAQGYVHTDEQPNPYNR